MPHNDSRSPANSYGRSNIVAPSNVGARGVAQGGSTAATLASIAAQHVELDDPTDAVDLEQTTGENPNNTRAGAVITQTWRSPRVEA